MLYFSKSVVVAAVLTAAGLHVVADAIDPPSISVRLHIKDTEEPAETYTMYSGACYTRESDFESLDVLTESVICRVYSSAVCEDPIKEVGTHIDFSIEPPKIESFACEVHQAET
ncbi:hypothetical protein BGW41_008251 [Actinomortierella wolfii]|nr:hypothetical protein BGW41_008251 [Actinomortierella wolfii]